MTEALLHTIWKYKLLAQTEFKGTKNEDIKVVAIGEHNLHSGPDFFNAKVSINHILLAGNVEIHIKTSDWLKHKHQNNKTYNNLILHVVYEHDIDLMQNEEFNVSVIELKSLIKPSLLEKYNELALSRQAIPCGKSIATIPEIKIYSWFDRLMVERLESKSAYIEHLFQYSKNNLEETLYILLCRNFGFKINGDAFELLAKSLPYAILKRYADNALRVEALMFGMAGFLDDLFEDDYPRLLQNEFELLRNKHQLIPLEKEIWKFSKTRPANFPTIRLSQLANLIQNSQSLYHLLEEEPPLQKLELFFDVTVHPYWKSHFKFDSVSEESHKPLGEVAFNAIVINTIVPFLFFYSKRNTNEQIREYAFDLLTMLKPEANSKTKEFTDLGLKAKNALESQAQIELYDAFCSKKACLHCNLAEFLLKAST
ncbi:MAG: DUF2851 family protein [Bacteroidota bacterium]